MTQDQAFKIMKTGVNIYLTGSAGSGKTYLLNKYIEYLKEHNISVAVTASTGIASTHMNGMTIHSWSGMGIKNNLTNKDIDSLTEKKYLWKRFEKARVLIIDEISMLSGNQLDNVNKICKEFKRNDLPFGGLQVILSGDFFQLPPVFKKEENISMVYESEAWAELKLAICYLKEQHRQQDNILTEILNTIRNNNIEQYHYEHLEKRINIELENTKPTKLYTHNLNVDSENEKELSQIDEEEKIFEMTDEGPEILVEILKKSSIALSTLSLKIGAEIMCIKNNFEEGYVNGSRGKIVGFDLETGYPEVLLYNGLRLTIKPATWAIEEDSKVKASITQIPLRLAWAITIHKSQGMSLDNAEIDLRSTFSYGMGYVALSRVKSLSGIKLLGLSRESLQVDPKVLEFDKHLQEESLNNQKLFEKLKIKDQDKMEQDFIERMGGNKKKSKNKNKERIIDTKTPTILITKELLEKGKNIKEISKERNLTQGTITHHIEQIKEKFKDINISHIKPKGDIIKLVREANKKLKGDEVGKLSPIKTILEKQGYNFSFEQIRIARLFI